MFHFLASQIDYLYIFPSIITARNPRCCGIDRRGSVWISKQRSNMADPGSSTSHVRSNKTRTTQTEAHLTKNIRPRRAPIVTAVLDDDDRMLATIGYRQVLTCRRPKDSEADRETGAAPELYQMDHRLLCHLHSWGVGVGSRHIWYPHRGGWSSNRGVGLVHRIMHGRMHSTVRYLD